MRLCSAVPYASGMALVITLLIVGAVLLALETLLPGMILGILGFGSLVGAVVAAYSEFGTRGGNFVLLGVTLGLVLGTIAWMRFFPDSRLAQRFVSHGVIGNVGAEQPELLNQTGVAYTNLRPSGTAVINGKRVDVVTEGSMIERGMPVKVVAVEGLRVVVRAVPDVSTD